MKALTLKVGAFSFLGKYERGKARTRGHVLSSGLAVGADSRPCGQGKVGLDS
jgi:hypothetical protein